MVRRFSTRGSEQRQFIKEHKAINVVVFIKLSPYYLKMLDK